MTTDHLPDTSIVLLHEEIIQLRKRIEELEAERDRAECGRRALIDGFDHLERIIDRHGVEQAVGRTPNPAALVEAVRASVTVTHKRHGRMWGRLQ